MTTIKLKNWLGEETEWSDYELGDWIIRFGSFPVELTASEDFSGSYEMIRAHIFKLQNNKYAYVEENGCSCYEPTDAEVVTNLSLSEAKKRMKQFHKEHKGYNNW